jgi:hypothetical protein
VRVTSTRKTNISPPLHWKTVSYTPAKAEKQSDQFSCCQMDLRKPHKLRMTG